MKLLRSFFRYLTPLVPAAGARLAVRIFYNPRKHRIPEWERAAVGRARQRELPWRGESLRVCVWGEGPTVLLVHGWEGRGSQFAKLAGVLEARGYRVISFDGPAHGDSRRKSTTLVEFSEAVARMAQEYGPLYGAVGHSFGAAALCIALRKGAAAERVVLFSCPLSLRHVVTRFAGFLHIPDSVHERMYGYMAQLHGCPESDLSIAQLAPQLDLPCLMIHDADDRYVPFDDGEAVSRKLPQARMLKTKGLGHVRALADPSCIAAAADFLDAGAVAGAGRADGGPPPG